MKVYGVWCNSQKAWYTNSKVFNPKGMPKTWSLRSNAQACIKERLRWSCYHKTILDLRIVELDLTPVDNSHLV